MLELSWVGGEAERRAGAFSAGGPGRITVYSVCPPALSYQMSSWSNML